MWQADWNDNEYFDVTCGACSRPTNDDENSLPASTCTHCLLQIQRRVQTIRRQNTE